MRTRLLALTTAFTLLFGVTCVNSFDCDLTAIAVTENDDVTTTTTTKPKTTTTKTTTTPPTTTTKTTTTTAHVHNWVDVTETRTIHHDAEYAKRRYWLYDDLAQDGMPLSWVTIPSNSTHLESYDGFRPTQYQILMTWYGSWDNIPSEYVTEWITKDNCADYGLTYNTMANYANPYTTSPDGKYIGRFNPDYDVIVCIDIDAFNDACDGIANGRAYDWHDISKCYGDLDDFYLPVAEDNICVKDAWDETTTVVVGHKCTSCGATDYVMGDINGDEEFTVADVVLLQKWLLAVPDAHMVDWEMGNLCRDDRLDVFDLCLMKKALLEK